MVWITRANTHFKVLTIILLLLALCFIPQKARTVVEPEAILWKTNNLGAFINSAYRGVLGRNPSSREFQVLSQMQVATKKNKADLFWALVNSVEYHSIYGDQQREYWVYWDTEREETEYGVNLCRCYLFSKDEYVFMPTIQYLGIHCPSGPFTFGVASAVRYMYASFDDNTCTLFNCGYQGEGIADENTGRRYEDCLDQYCPGCQNTITLLGISSDPQCNSCMQQYKAEIEACQSSQRNNYATNNLVRDPNFESFGLSQSQWTHGNQYWGNSGYNQSTAQKVNLPQGSRPTAEIYTALMIQNYSGRGPHVYGTTMQKIPVTRGKTYKISVWAAAEGLASNSGVLISVDAQWRVRPIRLSQGTYGWTSFQGEFTATGDYAFIRIIAEDRGKVYLTGLNLSEEYF